MPNTGQTMPPSGAKVGSPSQAIDNARKTSQDGWNQHGNHTADEALKHDKAVVRKNLDPASLGPSGK